MIVPGGGLSLDGERFIPCRRRFFLPVRVLSRLFRRLCLERLTAAYERGLLILEGSLVKLASPAAFAAVLKPLRRINWFVYAKRPFAGPKTVLAYLSRYTHRVAISNTRLIVARTPSTLWRHRSEPKSEQNSRVSMGRYAPQDRLRQSLVADLASPKRCEPECCA